MKSKVVVIDDDPTGTQTVSGVPVLTRWTVDELAAELNRPEPALFLLSNSRSMPAAQAVELATKFGVDILQAERESGVLARVVSRSDSTLRGHFPAETSALARALEDRFTGTILCPYFSDGGRITKGDIHYLVESGRLVPVGETEFAKDRTFGFKSSNLRDWVVEKYKGSVPPVVSLSIEDARSGHSLAQLRRAVRGSVIIVNAETEDDLAAQVMAVKAAEAEGFSYLFRTAADWVCAYANIPRKPVLAANEYVQPGMNGGLFVVGSYVSKTSEQLEQLLAKNIVGVRLDFESLDERSGRSGALSGIARHISERIVNGCSVVLYTSRNRSMAGDLCVGSAYSAALVKIVSCLHARPSFLVAKGGITSSDVATKALGLRRAEVMGQAMPGVPVWKCGVECKWPNISLVVFPGNVGSPGSLADLYEAMETRRRMN